MEEYSSRFLEQTLDHMGVGIFVTDYSTGIILYVNKFMAESFDGADKLIGKKYSDFFDEKKATKCSAQKKDDLAENDVLLGRTESREYYLSSKDTWYCVFSSTAKWADGRTVNVITCVDITENKRNELLISDMAFTDALTKIPNRRKFEKDFTEALSRSAAQSSSGYVMFVDLDNFKHINDAFSHEVGDKLLITVAKFMNEHEEFGGHVYRYGGDEFILFFEDLTPDAVMNIADAMIKRYQEPWIIDNEEYFCTASIGLSGYPKDGTTYHELLNSADKAMYTAKNSGKGVVAQYVAPNELTDIVIQKEFALRRAMADDFKEFEIYYHPFIDAKTGKWVGVEALVRWNSSIFGFLKPADFVPICEEINLIIPLGYWILDKVIATAVKNSDTHYPIFYSVNVSAAEINYGQFVQDVIEIIDKYGFNPNSLYLEIKESHVVSNIKNIKNVVQNLQKKGVRVSLDGLGTGYSSLQLLKNISFDMIKIDHSFILDCLNDKYKRIFAKTVVLLARAAGTPICAEGVHNKETMDFLIENGYDFVQGTHFAVPVPYDEFVDKLLNTDRA